jgi:hypothetical protein
MAGGMQRQRGIGLTLAQRAALGGVAPESAPTPHRRHCWVAGPDQDPGPWPGLVLDWRRSDDGWSAWVVYLVGEGEPVAVQGWVERERLTPASDRDRA